MVATPPPTDGEHSEHRALAALLLRGLGTAVLSSAATVATLAWIEGWDGAPDLGVATYLFWPLLVGGLVLIGWATRLRSLGPAQQQDADTRLP